jgi:hydrogenase/urease accessory protein HupE
MLVFLGVRTLLDARARTGAAAASDHVHLPIVRGRQPFAIGVVHGLAGSGALAALVAVGAPSSKTALACLALYSVGTVFGMVALATAASPVLAHARRAPTIGSAVARLAGVASLAIGAVWIVRTVTALTE